MKSKKFEDEFKAIIPKNVDPIKLADKIKGDLTGRWLKNIKQIRSLRSKKLKGLKRLKSHLVQQSQFS